MYTKTTNFLGQPDQKLIFFKLDAETWEKDGRTVFLSFYDVLYFDIW